MAINRVSDREMIEAHRAYLADDDMSVDQVASVLGCSHVTVYQRWNKLGLNRRSNQAEIEEMAKSSWEMYEQGGRTQEEVAAEFGVPITTLRGRWIRLGLYERRSPLLPDELVHEAGERFERGESVVVLAEQMSVPVNALRKRLSEMGYVRAKATALKLHRRGLRLDVNPPAIRQAWCAIWSGETVERVMFASTPQEAETKARQWVRRKNQQRGGVA